jgi:hypothetical protein
MYNLHCLEWHLDGESTENPADYCVVLQGGKRDFCRFNRLAAALAKSQDHRAFCGVFAFADRTPHDSSESAWTAWKKTPHTSTPLVQNVTSVDLATGKAHSTSVVNKAVCISEQIRQAHLGLFWFFNLIGVNE